MRQPKRILVLSSSEYRQMLHGLIYFRNKLIQDGFTIAITGIEGMGFHVCFQLLCDLIHVGTSLPFVV